MNKTKNPFKYWIWDDKLNKEYRIRAYIMNVLIWLVFILIGIVYPIVFIKRMMS